MFDPEFSADSYGVRPGRNAHQAVRRVQSVLKEGRRFTVDVDLSKFFDRVNHDLLMTHLLANIMLDPLDKELERQHRQEPGCQSTTNDIYSRRAYFTLPHIVTVKLSFFIRPLPIFKT
nr:reverse transcriptase domain-containing protein [Marinobacter sp. ATCH36]